MRSIDELIEIGLIAFIVIAFIALFIIIGISIVKGDVESNEIVNNSDVCIINGEIYDKGEVEAYIIDYVITKNISIPDHYYEGDIFKCSDNPFINGSYFN